MSSNDAFALLTRFLFVREDMQKRVGQLSGGERNRLQLARLLVLKANFLILDEPTNHLDISAREAHFHAGADSDRFVVPIPLRDDIPKQARFAGAVCPPSASFSRMRFSISPRLALCAARCTLSGVRCLRRCDIFPLT